MESSWRPRPQARPVGLREAVFPIWHKPIWLRLTLFDVINCGMQASCIRCVPEAFMRMSHPASAALMPPPPRFFGAQHCYMSFRHVTQVALDLLAYWSLCLTTFAHVAILPHSLDLASWILVKDTEFCVLSSSRRSWAWQTLRAQLQAAGGVFDLLYCYAASAAFIWNTASAGRVGLLATHAASAAFPIELYSASADCSMAEFRVASAGFLTLETVPHRADRLGPIAQLHEQDRHFRFSTRLHSEEMIAQTLSADGDSPILACVDCRALHDPRNYGHIGRARQAP
eukprot:5706996-Amphidinium_carterae.2